MELWLRDKEVRGSSGEEDVAAVTITQGWWTGGCLHIYKKEEEL